MNATTARPEEPSPPSNMANTSINLISPGVDAPISVLSIMKASSVEKIAIRKPSQSLASIALHQFAPASADVALPIPLATIMSSDSSPFLDLPREIRDHIYKDVFRSSTGCVEIVPLAISWEDTERDRRNQFKNPLGVTEYSFSSLFMLPATEHHDLQPTISMGLVFTCKSINSETKELLWKLNTVHQDWTSSNRTRKLPLPLQMKIQRIHLTMELEFDYALPHMEPLGKMAMTGMLAELTIVVIRRMPDLELSIYADAYGLSVQNNCDLMESFTAPGGPLHSIKKIITVHLGRHYGDGGFLRYGSLEQRRWMGIMTRNPETGLHEGMEQGAKRVLLKIHNAFGGSLLVDDRLCFKDGAQIDKLVELKPIPALKDVHDPNEVEEWLRVGYVLT